jgi:hypothetical protein
MTLAQALERGRSEAAQRAALGFDQARLDQAAREGLAAGAFEETVEDSAAIVEEFYPEDDVEAASSTGTATNASALTLGQKLDRRLANAGPGEGGPS